MNQREQLAKENDMSIDFVNWFFDNKKEGCGNVWFMMMAAMWEGWKAQSEQVRQLTEQRDAVVAEMTELEEVILDITFMDDDFFFGSTQKVQIVMNRLVNIKTPATSAILDSLREEAKADVLDEMAATYRGWANEDVCSCNMKSSYNLTAERAENYAAYVRRQLRESKGAQS
ncbi:hypothetical protein [Phytobacter sp. AG2a]